MRKRVAAIVTEYRRHSHADVIVSKILEGLLHDGKEFPNLQLVSLYVDQFPAGELSRDLAQTHNFPILDSIEKALTLGGAKLALDGVLCIGEHGKYPKNERGQTLYPRRRFFEEVCRTFERTKQSVPVFNDKHLAATWADAKWMYDKARELFVPLMAGSSLPVTWRRPALTLPLGCELSSAVQIGYGPFEGYGFHALEALQCMVERRKGGEAGVAAVTCIQGSEMWKSLDRGVWSKELLEAALPLVPAHARGDLRELTARDQEAALILIEYRDGFRAAVAMLNGWVYEGDGGAFCFAARVQGEPKPVATRFYLQQPDPFAHFAYLLRAIDHMIQSGHAACPVERALLTTGILDAVMISKAERGRRVETPYLDVKYKPVDWPFATDPVPKPMRR
ncbi:MAG: hypothetical protein ACJ8F7_12080 [Gemmataceae bacterium]